MKEVSITVDIYCDWAWAVTPPVYRLYVNDDLLTERTYIWNNREQFIKEHILVNLCPGLHTLTIETVNDPCFKFAKRNITVDNRTVALVNNQFTVN